MTPAPSPSDRSAALRASDADRERIAEQLRRHHLDGRLDTDELQERLAACYAARTTGELEPLLADLPGGGAEPLRAARPSRSWPPALAAVALVLVALATAGAVAHGHPGPLPFVLVVLLVRFAWSGPRRNRTVWGAHG
jgi:Domain of unknown function (DUF1707)